MKRLLSTLALATLALGGLASQARADAPALFTQHCASCHGASRLGAMGPALLPDSLERLVNAGRRQPHRLVPVVR